MSKKLIALHILTCLSISASYILALIVYAVLKTKEYKFAGELAYGLGNLPLPIWLLALFVSMVVSVILFIKCLKVGRKLKASKELNSNNNNQKPPHQSPPRSK
jgi:hypothetical protein